MSRIFDALQRAERERSGVDSATSSAGPELIGRAELHAATEWSEAADAESLPLTEASRINLMMQEAGALRPDPAAETKPHSFERAPGNERQETMSRFQSLPIQLSEQSRLVCLTDKESPTAEALRLLAVRLRDLRRTKPLKKVLITSTIPQEGKSMIAGNLACTFAHATEERTLLIEGDLRRPSLTRMFGIRASAGLSDSLRDEKRGLRNICHLNDANVWILPAGSPPSNPLELLQSPRLPLLMEELAKCFDWIVIDSPPVLPLADTSIWMRLADGILLVTREGTTEKRQLQKGLEALDSKKVLGALVNSSVASAYSGYYYRSASHS